jgi:vitamin K-dependent gamma-carboxylase-like protein
MVPARGRRCDAVRRLLGADARSLAAFRIGLALVMLADLAGRATDLRAHYSDAGVLGRKDALTLFDWLHTRPLCLHLAGGTTASQALLFLVAGAAGLALLAGRRTRVAVVVAWLLTASVQLRDPFIGGGYDALLRMLLFWSCFAALDSPRLALGTVALLVQVAIVYLSAGWAKWNQPGWHDGSALVAILGDDFRVTAIGAFVARFPALVREIAPVVMGLELAVPFLLFAPWGPLRTAAVGVLVSMNVAFGLCLELGLFPWVSSVALLVFVPGWLWERPLLRRWAPASRAEHVPVGWLVDVLCAVFLIYLLGWSVGVARDPTYRAPAAVEWLGGSVFLQQDWRMFSEPPGRTGWIVIPARLADGTELDLFRAGGPAPRGDAGAAPVAWEKPARVARTFRNDRWRLLVTRAVFGDDKRLLQYGRYLCREWNASHAGGRQLDSFEVVFMASPALVPPAERRYEQDVVWRHHCFG